MSYSLMMDQNARAAFQGLHYGSIAGDCERMRAYGVSPHHPIVQEAIKKVERALGEAARSSEYLQRSGTGTAENRGQISKLSADALGEWNNFVAGVLSLDAWDRANFGNGKVRPPQTLAEHMAHDAKVKAERMAAEQVKIDAEQVIADAIADAVAAVTDAGGHLVVVTDVQTEMSWGATNVAVNKSVYIVGADVVMLPETVKATFRQYGPRIADELLAKQKAELASPTPVVADPEPVVAGELV